MDKLPPEIFHRIFTQLDLKQRLVCTLVCRSWWNILDRYSLFCNVELKKGKDQFNRFIDMIERLPDRAAQVEELHVVIKSDTCFNKRRFLNIFPNARVLRVESDWTTEYSESSEFTTPIDMNHSKSKVEFLSDFHHCELASQLLSSNLGGRLRTLNVDFCQVPNTLAVICQLKDLPVLNRLSLRSPKMNLVDLDNIHKNIPSIQDLTLDSVTILTAAGLPMDIVPATSITKFKFYYGSLKNAEMHALFYRYMAEKYTSITDIDCEDMRLLNYDSNERKHIYSNGILDFIKLIGPNQEKFTFNGLPDGVNPFEALDTVDCQIKYFKFRMCEGKTLLQYLHQSNQWKYIKNLDLINTAIDSIHLLKGMPALTTLSVYNIPPNFLPISLVDFLAACPPTLTSLSVKCSHSIVKPFKAKLDSIKNLDICCSTLTTHLGDIISSCFPNLVTLELTGEVKENVHITLHSPHFQEATFSTSGIRMPSFCKHGLSFNSPNQTETQYYICHKRQKTHAQYDDIQDLPLLSVISLIETKLDSSHLIKVVPFS
ncbi:hypothetical protein K501DRAFT_302990 [Backusella circina FSU 941]|nr:hypothetical protein K501DRAFT_302990 [Backusella circina FSU 941]